MDASRFRVGEVSLFAAYGGLLVLSMLTTSDAPPGHGLFVVQSLLWSLLGVATATWCVLRSEGLQWDRIDSLLLAWLIWTALSCLAVIGVGDVRSAVNASWQTVSWGFTLWIGRRLLYVPLRQQAMGWLMICVASIAAGHGLFQYNVITPAMRRAIEERPEIVLADAGIHAAVDSPDAKRFFDRARNAEPLASFTLTNSLAGFLLPGLVMVLACLGHRVAKFGEQPSRGVLIALLLCLLLLGTCLLLTQSRTGLLALFAGVGILLLRGWGVAWKWLAVPGLGLVLYGGSYVVQRGFDAQLYYDVPKSVQYRIEYWHSTDAMIEDHPLCGIGPGNFQSVYTRYMLAQASETIADPHNFLFEITATQGLPALLLFGTLVVCCIWRKADVPSLQASAWDAKSSLGEANALFLGGLGGLLLVPVITQLGGIDTNYYCGLPVIWWLGLPILWLARWSVLQRIAVVSRETILLALLVLLLNLLAAGGINFPSITTLMALLLALLTVPAATGECTPATRQDLTRWSHATAWWVWGGTLCVLSGCYLTGYKTVLEARGALYALHDAAANNAPPETLITLADAALQADPWDADLALQVAHHPAIEKSEALLIKAQDKLASIFLEAVRRNPRSARLYEAMGDQEQDFYRAIAAYEKAIERFPTNAALYAKLAATQFAFYSKNFRIPNSRDYLYSAGTNAREALRYDHWNPHADRKLAAMKFTNRFTSVDNLEEHMHEIIRARDKYNKEWDDREK